MQGAQMQNRASCGHRFSGTVSVVIAFVIFRVCLEIGYLLFVHPNFEYAGFVLVDSSFKYIESWLLTIVMASSLPTRIRLPSDFFFYVFQVGLFVPLLSFYGLADQSRTALYSCLFCYGLVLLMARPINIHWPRIPHGIPLGVMFLLLVVTLVTLYYLMAGGFRGFNLDMRLVYEIRDDQAQYTQAGMMGYLSSWVWKVFGPSLLCVCYIGDLLPRFWCSVFMWFGLECQLIRLCSFTHCSCLRYGGCGHVGAGRLSSWCTQLVLSSCWR